MFEIINVVILIYKFPFEELHLLLVLLLLILIVSKTLLTNVLSTFFIKGKPIFSNDSKILHKNLRDCPILGNSGFDNLILADELFGKALQNLNNLCGKLVLSLESPRTFDENFKVTLVPLFIPNFHY